MKIVLNKINPGFHGVLIGRPNGSEAAVKLHTETYFLHDLCHFVVESELNLRNGFWGMLEKGYEFEQLAGRTNELTKDLREIEKIVGITQSYFLGNVNEEQLNNYLSINQLVVPKASLDKMIAKIGEYMKTWKYLATGQSMQLEW